MSVVLRCPSCGTTRAASGECDACHEATVRHFCTNHTPGLWLDASTCPTCGARFGDAARRPSRPPAAIPGRTRSPASARAPAASSSARPTPYPRAAPPTASPGAWGSPERTRPTGDEEHEAGASRMALWQQILRAAAASARSIPSRAAPAREGSPIGLRVGGCLMRMVLLMVFLFLALASAAFLFGRALLF